MSRRGVAKFWMCAATKFSEENRAASHVERQGFEFYLPLVLSSSGRRELMFPGYLLIAWHNDWRKLASTRGIHKIIGGETPSRIRACEIEALRSREDERGFVRLHPRLCGGETVRPLVGGFSGLTGIVEGALPGDRCRVLFEVLGRSVPAVFEQRMLALA